MVSSLPWPQFTPWKDPVPILQEAGLAPVPVWTGGKSRLQQDSIPDRPANCQSLYQLSYPTHSFTEYVFKYKYFSVMFMRSDYILCVVTIFYKTRDFFLHINLLAPELFF